MALHPSTGTHTFVAATLAKQGRFAEAKKHYRRAIALAKNPAVDAVDEAYCNLGLIFRAEQKYAESLKMLKKAVELDPKYRLAWDALKDIEAAIRLRSELANTAMEPTART